ncbi:MAG: hypothetical protein U0136_14285 [Bdellovibrionota bacterium]
MKTFLKQFSPFAKHFVIASVLYIAAAQYLTGTILSFNLNIPFTLKHSQSMKQSPISTEVPASEKASRSVRKI